MKSLQHAVVQTNDSVSTLAGLAAGVFSAKMAAGFIKDVMSVRGEFQKLEVAFTTLLGSETKANKMMQDAVDLAAKTPFDLQGVAAGAKQLLAYGMEGDKVIDTLRRLGDVSAGLSLPLNRVVAIYGQVMAQGKLSGQTLRRFTMAGIPIVQELAKQLGKTELEIRSMISAGQIGFPQVQKAFEAMTDAGGKFDNLMEKQSATITGRISNIEDAISQMLNEIGEKTQGPINAALDVVQKLIDNYEKVGYVLAGLIAAYGSYRVAIMAFNTSLKVARLNAIGYNAATLATIGAEKGAMAAELTRIAYLKGLSEAQIEAALATDNASRALLMQIGASKGSTAAINAEIAATMKLIGAKLAAAGPYIALTALIVGMAAAVYKGTRQVDEYAAAEKRLSKQSKELNGNIAAEQATIDQLFGELKGAEKGTKEWDSARKKIYDKYGEYLKALGDEKTALNDIEVAYKLVGIAAKNSAMERARAAAMDNAGKEYGEKAGDVGTSIRDLLIKGYGDKKGAELFRNTISKYIGTQLSDLPEEVWKIMDDALAVVDPAWGSRTANKDGSRTRGRGERSRKDWTDAWATAAKARAEYNAEIEVAQDIFTTESPDAAIKRLGDEKKALEDTTEATKNYNAEQQKLTKQSKALQGEVTKLFSPDGGTDVFNKYIKAAKEWGKTQSDNYADDKALISGYLRSQMDALDAEKKAKKEAFEEDKKQRKEKIEGIDQEIAAQKAYKKLQNTNGGGGGNNTPPEDDGGYSLKKLQDRKKLQDERNAQDKAFALRQEEINKLADGYRKQELQAELDYEKAVVENRRKYEDELLALIEQDKQIWLKQKKGRKEKDYTVDAGGTDITADKNYYDQQEANISAAYNRGVGERFTDYLAQLGDVNAERVKLERDLNKQIAAEELAANDATLTEQQRANSRFLADRLKLVKEARIAEQEYETQKDYLSNDERLTAYKRYLEKRAKLEKEQTKKDGETDKQKADREARIDAKLAFDLAEFDFSQVVDFGSADEVLDKFLKKWKAKMVLFPDDMRPALEAEMNKELGQLFQNLAARGDNGAMEKWMNQLGLMTISELRVEYEKLKTELEGVDQSVDPAKWAKLAAQLKLTDEQIKSMQKNVKEGKVNWKEVGDVLNDVASTFNEAGEAIGGMVGELLQGFGSIASGAASMANAIQAIGEAASAAEKASAWLALIAAAIKVVSFFATSIKNASEETIAAAAANDAYADSVRSILNEARQLKEENIFGTNRYQQYLNEVNMANEAFAELEKNFDQRATKDTRNFTAKWLDSISPNSNFDPIGVIAHLIAPESGGISSVSLASFLDENGKFTQQSLDQLKEYYSQYEKYMDSTSKAVMQDWIRDGEEYLKHVEAQTEYLKSLVGDLAGSVSDSLVDSFVDAGDAFANLNDIAANFAKNLVKSRVQALLMKKIFTDENQQAFQDLITAGQTQKAIDFINSLLEKAKTDTEIINTLKALEGIDDMVAEEATKKGIATASQESVDENNGRLTAIQGHTFEINDSVKAIRDASIALASRCGLILTHVMGIHADTTEIKHGLAELYDDVHTTRNNVDTIVTKGVLAR